MNLKKYAAAAALVLAASSSSANDLAMSESAEYCKSIGDLAASIMELRQEGVAMSRLVEGFNKVQNDYSDITRLMVVGAYEQPRFTSEQYRKSAAIDFENLYYLACTKAEAKRGRK